MSGFQPSCRSVALDPALRRPGFGLGWDVAAPLALDKSGFRGALTQPFAHPSGQRTPVGGPGFKLGWDVAAPLALDKSLNRFAVGSRSGADSHVL